MKLSLFSIYHLNLAYSSIPVSRRMEVIKKCFWPLLEMAEIERIPLAITAPAYTIEVANKLEPSWVSGLRDLIGRRLIEFIGAGYSQLIGPLVPSELNRWNLDIGRESYFKNLKVDPEIWYVNEQAFSASLVDHYRRLNANAIVMEWNNPRTCHKEWNEEYRYFSQEAVGPSGTRIPLIWNDSITFQKFQRMAHGDVEVDELLEYLALHCGPDERSLCLYGNDAEIFDFRPGRFKAEPELGLRSEWDKIKYFYRILRADPRFDLVFPSHVVSLSDRMNSHVLLRLESASMPIPVKKQPKYNISRWAVTGRDSVRANSKCHRIYANLSAARDAGIVPSDRSRQYMRELCYLWSSDFRTHIVQDRWREFLQELEKLAKETQELSDKTKQANRSKISEFSVNGLKGRVWLNQDEPNARPVKDLLPETTGCVARSNGRFLELDSPTVRLSLDTRRGLAVTRLEFPGFHPDPLAGWIPHGYYTDIALSADWYTANSVLQRPGLQQLTDLERASTSLIEGTSELGDWIGCIGEIKSELGPIRKQIRVHKDQPQVDFKFSFDWGEVPQGSFKTAFLTLIPTSFDLDKLFYATHNGGEDFEVFRMQGEIISQDAPSSSIVSATSGLGATKGVVAIGDEKKGLLFFFDQRQCAGMPMVNFIQTPPSYFCRLNLSCGEMDETRTQPSPGPLEVSFSVAAMGQR
ncbi:MAG: hypothetical protein M1469_04860 [Bacteroidetes bacterium]|nr:hypothetical protein [Bacteroidota bacterium]